MRRTVSWGDGREVMGRGEQGKQVRVELCCGVMEGR